MFGVALLAGRRGGKRRPSNIVLVGFALSAVGLALIIPLVPRTDSGWELAIPLLITGSGLGLLVSQLNNYTLSPIEEEHVSEAAGVNSAAGSFGLSFGLAFAGAIMLMTLSWSFGHKAQNSDVLGPRLQKQVAHALRDDAQVISNTQLEEQLKGRRPRVQNEIIRINAESRHDALQIALVIPLLAALIGFLSSFRMMRLPDPEPSEAAEMMIGG
jgi:MFS family permease